MLKKTIKPICFYLPQFHTIPENDTAYGYGFTEWTNVKKAKPLFEGHNQPRVPLNNNYYCLLDPQIMKEQAKLAKSYGVYGFCYYHYWFKDGKKLLEKPIEIMLNDSHIDIPFCLCWANENWTKRWDGGDHGVIVEQDYGDFHDLKNHVDYLCEFFADHRYICMNDKPLLLIYKPELIPNLKKVIRYIRKRLKENGFKGINIAVQYPKFILDGGKQSLFDYFIEFEPQFIHSYMQDLNRKHTQKLIKKILLDIGLDKFVKHIEDKHIQQYKIHNTVTLDCCNYDKYWLHILNHKVINKKMIPGAFVDWDNTPRNINGRMFTGVSPVKFENYLRLYKYKIMKEYNSEFLFINAWNEWAEGAYLEPDTKNGYAYLEALQRAIK